MMTTTMMRRLTTAVFAVGCCTMMTVVVRGAPADQSPHIYKQPDGSDTPLLILNGDEFYNWMCDEKGFTVVKDTHGWYTYAEKTQDGDIVPTGVRVGTANPKKMGLTPRLVHDHKHRGSLHDDDGDDDDGDDDDDADDSSGESNGEHRRLVDIPEYAICSFEGSKRDPCRLKGLVVLTRFSDHDGRSLPSSQEYDVLFNNNGPTENSTAPSGSVADVFSENSYDTFVVEMFVSEWIRIGRTEWQTVDGNYGLNKAGTKLSWRQAMRKLDRYGSVYLPDYDFNDDGDIDCVVFLHSGSAAERGGNDCETGQDSTGRIWSHASSVGSYNPNNQANEIYYSSTGVRVNRFVVASGVWGFCPSGGAKTKWDIGRIGVLSHELAHFLGLPDLYDSEGGTGVGSFDLLSNMWGWYQTQYYPPLLSAWSKLKLGWVQATHVTSSGTYKIAMACVRNTVYLIDHNMPTGEYFLVEYRFPCGFDKDLSHHTRRWQRDRSGAALWHVDEYEWPNDPNGERKKKFVDYVTDGVPSNGRFKTHYKVSLVQSDGDFDLEYGRNKGDRFDLFMKATYSDAAAKSYKIDDSGVTKNSGQKLSEPNTKSYSGDGIQRSTGISLEFGNYQFTMSMRVVLSGTAPGEGLTDAAAPGTDGYNGTDLMMGYNETNLTDYFYGDEEMPHTYPVAAPSTGNIGRDTPPDKDGEIHGDKDASDKAISDGFAAIEAAPGNGEDEDDGLGDKDDDEVVGNHTAYAPPASTTKSSGFKEEKETMNDAEELVKIRSHGTSLP